ncbi:MAG: hypothetical protein NWE84_07785 [Candidatus Bathyarchaeota archaeon]|nr:hypothetical protein [Candidatus Bathyarchaeota archaeon]
MKFGRKNDVAHKTAKIEKLADVLVTYGPWNIDIPIEAKSSG